MTALVVSEMFGPTIQGEGPSCGRPAIFLRLGLCNLECGAGPGAAWKCDTPYTWDWEGKLGTPFSRSAETAQMSVDEVSAWTRSMPTDHVLVVTGGEPMIQSKALAELLPNVPQHRVEVETNGTLSPGDRLRRAIFNVSPKLPNSGQPRDQTIRPEILGEYRDRGAVFKFVCATPDDLDDVDEVLAEVGRVSANRVWVMPAGRDGGTLSHHAQAVADGVIERGWNLTPRLHVNIWGDERCR